LSIFFTGRNGEENINSMHCAAITGSVDLPYLFYLQM
jgi:hypothetical protein